MRSHAKAPSAGSNSGRGASRRSVRRPGALAALLLALLAAACLLPGSAFAIEFRTKTGSFGPDGTSGTSFSFPTAQALDQSKKRLYALDQTAHKMYGFDVSTPGSHPPLGGSFPLSEPAISSYDDLAADSSSHDIYLANFFGSQLFGFDESGAALAGFPVAVPGIGGPCGVGVDSAGNVWAATASEGKVGRYSPAGALLNTYTLGGPVCRLAFDSEDNLYTGDFEGKTRMFTFASGYTASTEIDPEYTAALAVDKSTDEVYVVHPFSVSVYDSTGALVYEFGAGGEYYGEFGGIAIDEATEEVFLSDVGTLKIDVFGPPVAVPKVTTEGADGIVATSATVHGTINPKGLAVEDCHFEVVPAAQFISSKYNSVTAGQKFPCVPAAGSIPVDSNPHAVSANATGLEPGTVYHYRLVAKNSIGEAKGGDLQFTSGVGAPLVQEQSVQAVGTSEATVAAKINPRGGETTYHVEYGTTNAYGQSTAESAPLGFSADNSKHPVSVHIGGLSPSTAYHFRFVATNSADSTEGADTTFATYSETNPNFAPCPDEQFRTGAGSRLPDCRAYEQGTPVDKHGANAQAGVGVVGASSSGDRFTFFTNGGLPTTGGSSALVPVLATRGPNGWSTDGFIPLTESDFFVARIFGVNEDLSAALVEGEGPGGVGRQLFLRDSETATFQPGPVVPGIGIESMSVVGFAADRAHVAFTTTTQLLPSAPAGKANIYDLDQGTLTLIDRVPAGAATSCDDETGPACVVPSEGAVYGSGSGRISDDGSRIFFASDPTKESFRSGRIYMREDGARTTWISASQRTTPDPDGEKPGLLQGISRDGSRAFFTSCEKLTDDSTANSTVPNACVPPLGGVTHGQDLYSYDVESGDLTDLTVDSNVGDPSGAGVQEVLGVSEDGSYVYFFAEGVLAPGASHTECVGGVTAKCNLYVYHDGITEFIARIRWGGTAEYQSRVSADGSALLFTSQESLTGYDNVGPCGNGGLVITCTEFFRYSAPEKKLTCVSCNPTGIPPIKSARLGREDSFVRASGASGGPSRNLSDDGNRVFFDSAEPLVSGDTNGVFDVYEWEAKGTGSCKSESQNGGCLYLISSGTDPNPSGFLDASRTGDHAFFITEQQLVPGDQDQLTDVYDAGVGAGLAAQHALSPPSCASTACQANPAPPTDQTPASATFQGPGNAHLRSKARKCPKGKRKVRSGGKVRCQKANKQHKRHHNRGGSK